MDGNPPANPSHSVPYQNSATRSRNQALRFSPWLFNAQFTLLSSCSRSPPLSTRRRAALCPSGLSQAFSLFLSPSNQFSKLDHQTASSTRQLFLCLLHPTASLINRLFASFGVRALLGFFPPLFPTFITATPSLPFTCCPPWVCAPTSSHLPLIFLNCRLLLPDFLI